MESEFFGYRKGAFTGAIKGPLARLDGTARIALAGTAAPTATSAVPGATVTAVITPWEPQPLPQAQAVLRATRTADLSNELRIPRLMIEARDGTKVPVSVLRRKDFARDGSGKPTAPEKRARSSGLAQTMGEVSDRP